MSGITRSGLAPQFAGVAAGRGQHGSVDRPLFSVLPPQPRPPVQGDPLPPHLWPPQEGAGTGRDEGVTSTDPKVAADPNSYTDPQGRVYVRRIDPATGHLQLEHNGVQADQAGNRLATKILIDIAPDGSASKLVSQRLDRAAGGFEQDDTTTTFDAAGKQTGEVSDYHSQTAGKESFEHTVATYANGVAIKRVTELRQLENASEPSGEKMEGEVTVVGTWDNGGQPLQANQIPLIDRVEKVTYTSPKQGINKDTDRKLTTIRHAVGPLNALTYPEPMTIIVRFEGRGDQYIERELSVPVDATGAPQMSKASVTRTDDMQDTHVKVLQNFRIWGGLASNLLGIAGINLVRGASGPLGRGLLLAGLGAGVAEMTGEGYALLDKRNDADSGRMFMSIYDTAWLGGIYWLTRGRNNALNGQFLNTPVSQAAAATTLGVAGLAGAGLSIAGRLGKPDMANPSLSLEGTQLGQQLIAAASGAQSTGSTSREWREVERFDPAVELGSLLDADFLDLSGVTV